MVSLMLTITTSTKNLDLVLFKLPVNGKDSHPLSWTLFPNPASPVRGLLDELLLIRSNWVVIEQFFLVTFEYCIGDKSSVMMKFYILILSQCGLHLCSKRMLGSKVVYIPHPWQGKSFNWLPKNVLYCSGSSSVCNSFSVHASSSIACFSQFFKVQNAIRVQRELGYTIFTWGIREEQLPTLCDGMFQNNAQWPTSVILHTCLTLEKFSYTWLPSVYFITFSSITSTTSERVPFTLILLRDQ